MDDLESIFKEAVYENTSNEPNSLSEKILKEADSEFIMIKDEERSRIDEEKDINKKIKFFKKELTKYKNIKNPKLNHVNQKRCEKRKEINKKIIELNMRLQEINLERQVPK